MRSPAVSGSDAPAQPPIVIEDVRILDLDSGDCPSGMNLLVEEGRIQEISDHPIRSPSAVRFRGAGRIVLPGLIDAHVHVIPVGSDLVGLAGLSPYLVAAHAARTMRDMLMRGFTTVRDAGGADGGLARAVETGLIEGPRLFPSGLALAQPGGQGDFRSPGEHDIGCPVCRGKRSLTRLAEGPAACRRAVNEEIASGATQIKIMASGGIASGIPLDRPHFTREELAAIVDAASASGTYVMAHAYENAAIRRCLQAGVRSIEHASLLDADTAAQIARAGAFVVPTLVVFDRLWRTGGAAGRTSSEIARFRELQAQSVLSLDRAREAGVAIGHGSDLDADGQQDQGREFRLKAEVLSPLGAIRSATIVNAALLGREHELGRIKAGYLADLLVLDGDPLTDIGIIGVADHLRLLMQGGRLVRNDLN